MVHGNHSKMSILLQLGGGKSESLLQRQFSNGPDSMDSALVRDEDVYHPPPQTTYASCFGLPYQDHNYGAPPPPTPPASPPPQLVPKVNGHIEVDDVGSTTVVTTSEPEPVVPEPTPEPVDDSITRCICGFQHDDGYMICCDQCGVWQHVDCMFTDRGAIPEVYFCELCQHRLVDKHRAILLQTAKREELSVTSSTESETETKQSALKKLKKGKKVKLVLGQQNKKTLDSLKKKKILKKVQKKKENVARKAVAKALKGGGGTQRWRNFQIYRGTRSNSQNLPNGPAGDSIAFPVLDHSYEEATNNVYSPNMQAILANRKTNGSHNNSVDASSRELLGQLCTVGQVNPSTKGLEVSEDLSSNRAIIEFRGKVMLREQFDTEYQDAPCQVHPYTLFYKGFDNLDLCVDASIYGNDARFVRRSCTANSEVRHVVENGQVLFFIYSTKSIPRSAEVTIPFDFSYQHSATVIECPCARASCPVAKAMKRLHQADNKSKVLKNKKRTNRPKSMDQPSPEKSAASITAPISRRRKSSPARTHVATSDHEMAEEPLIDVQSPKKEPLSSPPAGSAEATAESAEAAERRKKMTREERKMEAIMKAFEKLEKREERRKEALARMPRKSKDEAEVTSPPPPATKAKVEIESPPPPPPPPVVHEEAPQEELCVSEVKEEEAPPAPAPPPAPVLAPVPPEVKPERPKPTKGKKRKGHGTPARRRSRYNSSSSGMETSASLSAEESLPPTPASSVPVTPVGETPATMSPVGFRFPKTKKQMMNEWLSETGQEVAKPLSIKTEPMDDSNSGEEMADYIKTIPSPRSSLEHLRRNSLGSSSKEHHPCGNGPKGIGSAKKRWLRQAMVESGTQDSPSGSMSPLYNDATSPNPHAMLHSPGASSAADFVTPLKKRRLARESLSSEGPCPATPSTPSGPGLPGLAATGSLDHDEASMQSSLDEPVLSPGMEEAALKLRNGFRPHFSPLQPSTSSDNLFERLKQPLAEAETQPSATAAPSAVLNSSASSQMNDSAMSNEDLVDSGEGGGGGQEASPSRTACDSTVPGDRDSLNSASPRQQGAGSSSPQRLVTSQADSPQRPGSTPADSLQGAGLGSPQVDSRQPLPSSNHASPNIAVSGSVLSTIHEERTESESEVSVSNVSESVKDNKESVVGSSVISGGSNSEHAEENKADTTSAVSAGCSSCLTPSDSAVASCSSDSTGPVLPNVDSSENSLGGSPKQVDSSANASPGPADAVSSDSHIVRTVESSVESSDSCVEEAMDTSENPTASSSVEASSSERGAQEGTLVLCSSSSSSVTRDPAAPEVSASTDRQPAGPSVSTSHDVDNTVVANTTSSGVEGEGVSSQGLNTSEQVMDTVDSADKLNTSDSAAEISSSKTEIKRTDEESELEEGEIIDSSEDETEKASGSVEQNVPSSSSSCQDLDALRNTDSVESGATGDVTGTALITAAHRLTVSDSFSNGEVDSTSSHSTRTQLPGQSAADSSVSSMPAQQSGLAGPSRLVSSEVPVVHSCTCPVHPHGIPLNYNGVSDSTVGSSSGNFSAIAGPSGGRPQTPQERMASQQERKKVSLLEYRQRRRYSSHDREGSRYDRRESGRSSSSSSPTGSSRNKKNKGPSLAPLPLFDSHSPVRGGKKSGKGSDKWSLSATLAERQREKNSQMSLTERLRKEFGLSDADSDDDRDDTDTPPPPPPPRPSDMGSSPQLGHGMAPPGPRMVTPGQMGHPTAPCQPMVARQPVPGMVGQAMMVRPHAPTVTGIPPPPQIHQQVPHSMTPTLASHTLGTQPGLGHGMTAGGQPPQMVAAPGTPMMVPPPPIPPVSLVGPPQVSTTMAIFTQQQASVAMHGVSVPPPMMVQPQVSASMSLMGQTPLVAPMPLLGQPPPVSAPVVLPSQQGHPVMGQQAVPTSQHLLGAAPQGVRPPMGILPPGNMNQATPAAGDLPPGAPMPQPTGRQQQPAFHTNIAMGPNGAGAVSSTSHPAPRLPPPSVPPPVASPGANMMHPASQGVARPVGAAIPSLLSLPTYPTKPYNNGSSGSVQQPPQEIESYTTSSAASSQRQYPTEYQGQMYVEPTADPIASAVQAAAFQAHSSHTASPHSTLNSTLNGPASFHRPRTPQGFTKQKGKK